MWVKFLSGRIPTHSPVSTQGHFSVPYACPDQVKNEEVLQAVKEERNIVQTVKWKKTNWIGHILR
jgi:hypothetical protein